MKKVLEYLKPYLGWVCLGLAFKFFGTIMDLQIPRILAYTIDEIVPSREVRPILFCGLGMVLCALLCLGANILANRLACRAARDTVRQLRHDLYQKTASLSAAQTDAFTIPSLETRLTTDTYNIHRLIRVMQGIGIRAPILLLGGLCMTMSMEPRIGVILLCALPLIGVVIWQVSSHGIKLFAQQQKAVDQLIRIARESIVGIRVIKALSKMDYEREHFERDNQEVVKWETKASSTMAITNPSVNLILNIGLTTVVFVGAYLVNAGITQPGKILAFMTYFSIILSSMLAISRVFTTYSKGAASAARISEILDAPQDLQVRESEPVQEDAFLVFDHVSFSYQKGRDDVHDISFALKKGQTLGIIGATGSGKSTIVSLLLRRYDADSGSIRVGGREISSYRPAEYHKKFGVVFQNDSIFADTIRGNIDLGREIPGDQMQDAVKKAQAWDFVSALDDGLEHPLSTGGTNLSGGQKQRVLIARALAAHPEILILDDSSSALDYRTDANLRAALRESRSEMVTVVIAQRISSIRSADHILVLEDGECIGSGTNEQLMEQCEVYRQISHSQMGGGAA